MGMSLTVRRFTVDEYHRMAAAGILHEDDRVELLDGQIVVMSPIGPRHAGCVDRLNRLFIGRLNDAAVVRVQNPVVLDSGAEPEPDIAVVAPPIERYADAHPGPADTLLVIEVADASVEFDRENKLPRYGKAGIPEAWLVNLPAETIEVSTNPGPDGYALVRRAGRGDMLRPIMLPGLEIPTGEILG